MGLSCSELIIVHTYVQHSMYHELAAMRCRDGWPHIVAGCFTEPNAAAAQYMYCKDKGSVLSGLGVEQCFLTKSAW